MNIGIGFLAGRTNVCNIINHYHHKLMKQLESYHDVKLVFYILYDLSYQNTAREEFYQVSAEVYKDNIDIRYISPEDIEEEKKKIMVRSELKKEDVDKFIGNGYGRARNTIMYFAVKEKMDYLFFWDDDEYPVACVKKENEVKWIEQTNLLEHIKHIKNADVTMGLRCGYMSPTPYVRFNEKVREEDFKTYIEAVSNEAVSWEYIKKQMETNKGITYAQEEILNSKDARVLPKVGKENWLLGSGICLNLMHLEAMPAFYNPPLARGEDAFFSTWLEEKTVISVPTYHFHDGFLQYTEIMEENYPKELKETALNSKEVNKRFWGASKGWVKYKPLLIYITQQAQYREKIEEMREKLEVSIPKMNLIFKDIKFDSLLDELEFYSENVEMHFDEYKRVNEIWNKIKKDIVE